MREKPIIFSSEMIQAILAGRKTQTRRVINPQPIHKGGGWWEWGYAIGAPKRISPKSCAFHADTWMAETGTAPIDRYCLYGQPGDQLWVRETWDLRYWEDGGTDYREWHGQLPEFLPSGWVVNYRAGWQNDDPELYQWRPSIFMPRWASRINLLIKDVRVERLQEIIETDAIAEGVTAWHDTINGMVYTPEFKALWDTINAKLGYSWASNPWVWVIEFDRLPD